MSIGDTGYFQRYGCLIGKLYRIHRFLKSTVMFDLPERKGVKKYRRARRLIPLFRILIVTSQAVPHEKAVQYPESAGIDAVTLFHSLLNGQNPA